MGEENKRKRRVAVMARVSTETQSEEQGKASIPEQLRLGREYAERQGWEVIATLAETISGTTPYRDRPAVQDLLDLAAAGMVDTALWVNADREGRGRDQEDMEEHLARYGVEVWLVEGGARRRVTADEVIVEGIKDLVARSERMRIRERLARGRYAAAKKGQWAYGNPPRGYRVVDKRLVVDEDEAEVIRFMFKALAAGQTHTKVAAALNDRFPFRPKKGGVTKPFTASEWSSGHVHTCFRLRDGYAGHGFEQEVRPRGLASEPSEVVRIPAEAIISDELLEEAQTARQTRLAVTRPHPRQVWPYPLTGRVRHVHSEAVEEEMTGRKTGAMNFRRMKCRESHLSKTRRNAPCPGFGYAHNRQRLVSIDAGWLEAQAVLALTKAFRNPKTVESLLNESQERAARVERVKDDAVTIEAALAKVKDEEGRLVALYTKDRISEEALDHQAEDIRRRKDDLEGRLVALRSEVAALPTMPTLDALMSMSVGYPILPKPTCGGMASPGSWATDPETGEDWLEEPGWDDILDALAREADDIVQSRKHEPSQPFMNWLEQAAALVDLKVKVFDIGGDKPGYRFDGRVVLPQPFKTPRGRNRATGAAKPAKAQTPTTASTSL